MEGGVEGGVKGVEAWGDGLGGGQEVGGGSLPESWLASASPCSWRAWSLASRLVATSSSLAAARGRRSGVEEYLGWPRR